MDKWIPCNERLPEKSGSYLTYLHAPLGFCDGEWSFVTEMHFDMGQMLWNDSNVSYNAVLSAVYKDGEYFVSHWMPLPEPPKETHNEE